MKLTALKLRNKKPEIILSYLNEKEIQFNSTEFIKYDPIQIPHRFIKKQDIEIAGLFAATLAWGQRKTIIVKCKELLHLMDNTPHDFVVSHTENDLRSLVHFRHRTFNATDLLYFISFLRTHYQHNSSLESLFSVGTHEQTIEKGLVRFHNTFFSLPHYPERTKKHIATPQRNSACKRLNMYLRWMVRSDKKGVDFGLWKSIRPNQLICPLDVHVERVARELKLISRKQTDWHTAVELTNNLKKFDPYDPVKYDFALFGLGIEKFRHK